MTRSQAARDAAIEVSSGSGSADSSNTCSSGPPSSNSTYLRVKKQPFQAEVDEAIKDADKLKEALELEDSLETFECDNSNDGDYVQPKKFRKLSQSSSFPKSKSSYQPSPLSDEYVDSSYVPMGNSQYYNSNSSSSNNNSFSSYVQSAGGLHLDDLVQFTGEEEYVKDEDLEHQETL